METAMARVTVVDDEHSTRAYLSRSLPAPGRNRLPDTVEGALL
jgi:hypothetical protein